MINHKKNKNLGSEFQFLVESILGIFFLLFLIITVIFLYQGFDGIMPKFQFVIPFIIGVAILAFTILLRQQLSPVVKGIIYFLYIFVLIICLSGSFNFLFSFLTKDEFYIQESTNWIENLTYLESSSNKILQEHFKTDSLIAEVEAKRRQVIKEIEDKGYRRKAKKYFDELNTMTGGNLKEPSNRSSDSTVIEENTDIINEQIDDWLADSEKKLEEENAYIEETTSVISGQIAEKITALSNISDSENPEKDIQEASFVFTKIKTDIEVITEKDPSRGLPDTGIKPKKLGNILDTFSTVGSPEGRKIYFKYILFALIFSFLIEGLTIVLSLMLASTPDNRMNTLIHDFEEEHTLLSQKQKDIESKVAMVEKQKNQNYRDYKAQIKDASDKVALLSKKVGAYEKDLEQLIKTRQAFSK